MAIVDAFIAELKQEGPGTRKVLERLPAADFGWRPHEKSFTMGQLAGHVAEMLSWATTVVGEDEFDMQMAGYKPFSPATTEELLAEFDKNQQQMLDALNGVPDDKMLANWRMTMDGKELFNMPRVAVIRGVILNHLIHHRAQLTVYMRMRNAPVPALYGPSADEE
jgi:uncharacterized damage-inducible protein DinB